MRYEYWDESSEMPAEAFEYLLERLSESFVHNELSRLMRGPVQLRHNGVCESEYSDEMLQFLDPKPTAYVPCYLNPGMLLGAMTIQEHLATEHRIPFDRVNRWRVDNCFRIHDLIHERERT